MNNLTISKYQANNFLQDFKEGRYVPSLSFMFPYKEGFVGVNNSRHQFECKKFTDENSCLDWLEESYSNRLQESIKNFPRLREWMTIQNLMDADVISGNTTKHAAIRRSLYKGENIVARLVRTYYDAATDSMTFIFNTPATMKAHEPGYTADIVNPLANFSTMPNPTHTYTMMIQVLDFLRWLKDTRPDNLGQITWREIKDVLDVAYVRVWCNCKSFHWFGKNYRASQFDASIYPTNIPDTKMRKRFPWSDLLCKHLGNLMKPNAIQFFLPQMASASQKVLRQKGLI